jgi:hypothetical protein
VGYSNGSIRISGRQTVAQANQSVALYGVGNTTQNSSTTLDARTLSFGGRGDVSVATIAEELCRIAFCDPAELFDENGRLKRVADLPAHVRAAIASVETVRGGGIKIKL